MNTDWLNNLSTLYLYLTNKPLLSDNPTAYSESMNNNINYLKNESASSDLNNTHSSSTGAATQHSSPIDSNIVIDPISGEDINNTNLNNLSINDYPWELLPNLMTLNNVQIIYIFIMFNGFIVNQITNSNIDIYKFLPNNKLGVILNKLITRYIKIWKTSYIFLFIGSFVCLLITNFAIKFGLHQIIVIGFS